MADFPVAISPGASLFQSLQASKLTPQEGSQVRQPVLEEEDILGEVDQNLAEPCSHAAMVEIGGGQIGNNIWSKIKGCDYDYN